ncbi:unnamed protein product [Rhizophagus irregularis]|nr:unnamed protein product [Rhizophagus irregularis]
MIFIGSTQTAPLNKQQSEEPIYAYVDLSDNVVGDYFWTNFDSYQLIRLFTKGFKKDTNIQNYEFFVITKNGKKIDYTKNFRKTVKIFPAGGTTPFQKNYEGNASKFVGGTFFCYT